ncbi:unnamed protein product [Ceratitis capitata]|uniref:(Mediterranean fruit fly) hypothetical protein n=1 Tax=Ceratitis capitata TaxID=7213 RepID=A0A811UPG8_CERCA|nr:unnamed protein product [Ceratitis capitata]
MFNIYVDYTTQFPTGKQPGAATSSTSVTKDVWVLKDRRVYVSTQQQLRWLYNGKISENKCESESRSNTATVATKYSYTKLHTWEMSVNHAEKEKP